MTVRDTILKALAGGSTVTSDELVEAVYGYSGPLDPLNNLRVEIHALRASGVKIERVNGYRLVPRR